ncbi:hypothetical protein ASE08_08460 [Rhizobacter sp. Root16D2]|nr:hypothetical protein ASC88_14990 [Rhizobacter sp. Root29]KQW04394.1 hypothetical protein ASC98_04680 [Rhizobacter sp. Root1238]KRB14475.1 hypothetical protein ASE08_08460 [Rhizobacter sp. Root16D2]
MALVVVATAAAACLAWLKAEHRPAEAIAVAQAFVNQLNARGEGCRVDRLLGVSPRQTNGNRLRRWAAGRSVDEPELQMEFDGACPLRVTLRLSAGEGWQVVKHGTHAG